MKLLRRLDETLERLLHWGWRNRRALGLVSALALAGWGVMSAGDEAEPTPAPAAAVAEAAGLGDLFDQLWVDKLPKSSTDTFRMYFFLKRGGEKIGVHLIFHSMTYRTQEFFGYEAKGDTLALKFRDPDVTAKTKIKIAKHSARHFDRKATFAADPQTKGVSYTYYRIKQRAAAEALARYGVDVPALRAQLGAR